MVAICYIIIFFLFWLRFGNELLFYINILYIFSKLLIFLLEIFHIFSLTREMLNVACFEKEPTIGILTIHLRSFVKIILNEKKKNPVRTCQLRI
jgi:hypothetical protein